jgi:hypothetical protein
MATKQDTAAPPVIQGALDYQRPDWLPEETPLDWVNDLRKLHLAAVRAWALAVEAAYDIVDEVAEGQVSYRRTVREALAAGLEAPPAPPSDPVANQARVAIAQEDVHTEEERLAETVVDVLAILRTRRRELDGHLGRFSAPLLRSLTVGPGGRTGVIAERLRRQLAELEGEPSIEVFDENNTEEVRDAA